ncbi:MAG: CoA transferase [Thermodesulfobacteriota bacterium]
MTRALEEIRVLDLGSYIAAPYCCMLLADHGAEVIRVEPPKGRVDREVGPFSPDGQPITFGLTIQRNKKNITLNLNTDTGRIILGELVKKADILVHNSPKGSKEAQVLGYDKLCGINPALIVVAISGFGQEGPFAERPCFDAIAQAMCGSMSFTGYPGTPPLRAALSYIDFNTAARAALGALMAYHERQISGRGQLVDIALFDVAFSIMGTMGCPSEILLLGEERKQVGNGGFYAYCCSGRATDGYVMINVVGNSMWRRLCRVIGREDLVEDPRFLDNLQRYRNYEAIDLILNDWLAGKTVDEAIKFLDEAGIPCGPVNSIPEALKVPQVAARQMLVELEYPETGKIPMPGVDIKLSRTPGQVAKRASLLGEDNEAVYRDLLGYKPADLLKFRVEQII